MKQIKKYIYIFKRIFSNKEHIYFKIRSFTDHKFKSRGLLLNKDQDIKIITREIVWTLKEGLDIKP